MILSQERWMNLRAFKALAEAGATWAEIARETGHDWRTVKRYLSAEASSSPPTPAKRGPGRARSTRTPTWSTLGCEPSRS
jgi:predicted transcriptional regulator